MKIKDLLMAQAAMSEVLNMEVKIKSNYALSKISKQIQDELTTYEEKRKELVTKYGEVQEDGTIKIIDSEKEVLFASDYETLVESEATNTFYNLSLTQLYADLPDKGFKPALMLDLMPFITDDMAE